MVKEVRNLMNEVVKNILERRSWRSYEDRQISDQELDTILQCGLWAPSAMNQQSCTSLWCRTKSGSPS